MQKPYSKNKKPAPKNLLWYCRPTIGADEKREVLKTLSSDWLITGPKTALFEDMLSDYTGARYVKALNSCTSALNLAVLSCGIGPGDEVITTPFTFCATVNAIIHSGGRPVFADIDKNTFNIDPAEIEKKITRRTKAILAVDYGGLPCDMDKILSLGRRYRLKVIKDAAHAIGAEYKGRKIGNISDVSCFSFHAVKNITTGEGGAISTNSSRIMEFIRKVYFHGLDKGSYQRHNKGGWKYSVAYPGFKYNMNDISASLGIHQLKRLDEFIDKRSRIASLYDRAFGDNPYLRLQGFPYGVRHAHHLYPVVLRTERLKISREEFMEKLIRKGIMTSVHFIPIYKHPAYKRYFAKSDIKRLENTEDVYKGTVSLPIYPRLTITEANYIISAIESILKQNIR